MDFVDVTHPTQGTANVPVVAVPHMVEKGWQVVGSDALAESAPSVPDETTGSTTTASPGVVDGAEGSAE